MLPSRAVTDWAAWEKKRNVTLDIEGPTATCGDCGFQTRLSGEWSVEDGRLVWRGDADLQPGRGPDLNGCCESREIAEFRIVTVDDKELSAEDVAALRQSASEAER